MRKFYLVIASCVALVAFMGFSANAFALTDPDCDGDPYDNTLLVHDFSIEMIDSYVAGEPSGLGGSGLACRTDISFGGGGAETIFDHADISNPDGVKVGHTSVMANTRFVGTARLNVAGYGLFGEAHIFGVGADDLDGPPEGISSILSIDSIANCDAETPVGGDVPGTIIACYKGTNPLGFNYSWIIENQGRTNLTIGPFHPLGGVAGMTRIHEFNLCAYVGAPGGSTFPDDCGTSSDPFLQKNGIRRDPCYPSAGIYGVTATTRGGEITPRVTTRVNWRRGTSTSSESGGGGGGSASTSTGTGTGIRPVSRIKPKLEEYPWQERCPY